MIGGGGGIAVVLPSLFPVIGRPFCTNAAEGSSFAGIIAGDMGAAGGIMQETAAALLVSSSSINFIKFIKVKFLSGAALSVATLTLAGVAAVVIVALPLMSAKDAPPATKLLLDISCS